VEFDAKTLFAAAPDDAPNWYSSFLEGAYVGCYSADMNRRYIAHQHAMKAPELNVNFIDWSPFFMASYIDHKTDVYLKRKMNKYIQEMYWPRTNLVVSSSPVRHKIAWLTNIWRPEHPVYDSMVCFLMALRATYDVTLVFFGEWGPDNQLHVEGFNRVIRAYVKNGQLDVGWLQQNDFSLVFYPEVGMSIESLLFSNFRFAPIQVVGFGHPASTSGSKIDYYLSGTDIEPPDAESNYSERLIMLPGLGTAYRRPSFDVSMVSASSLIEPSDPIVINCAWTSMKINHHMLTKLQSILHKASRPIMFRFFPSLPSDRELIVVRKGIEGYLGASAEVFPVLRKHIYLQKLKEGHLYVDSMPFGAVTTCAVALHTAIPMVTQLGPTPQSRWSAAQLSRIGLGELVAQTEKEFIDKVLRIVHDDGYRVDLSNRIRQMNMQALVFDDAVPSALSFRNAIDFLIENHASLQKETSRKPIELLSNGSAVGYAWQPHRYGWEKGDDPGAAAVREFAKKEVPLRVMNLEHREYTSASR